MNDVTPPPDDRATERAARIHAYLHNELDGHDVSAFEAEMAGDPALVQQVERARALLEALADAGAPAPPFGFSERLKQRLDDEQAAVTGQEPTGTPDDPDPTGDDQADETAPDPPVVLPQPDEEPAGDDAEPVAAPAAPTGSSRTKRPPTWFAAAAALVLVVVSGAVIVNMVPTADMAADDAGRDVAEHDADDAADEEVGTLSDAQGEPDSADEGADADADAAAPADEPAADDEDADGPATMGAEPDNDEPAEEDPAADGAEPTEAQEDADEPADALDDADADDAQEDADEPADALDDADADDDAEETPSPSPSPTPTPTPTPMDPDEVPVIVDEGAVIDSQEEARARYAGRPEAQALYGTPLDEAEAMRAPAEEALADSACFEGLPTNVAHFAVPVLAEPVTYEDTASVATLFSTALPDHDELHWSLLVIRDAETCDTLLNLNLLE